MRISTWLACTLQVCSLILPSLSTFLPNEPYLSEILVRQHVSLERQKRYLLYPSGDPARAQMIIGLGVPVDLEDQSVTIGYVIKILYHVPQVASDYSSHMFGSASLVRAFGSDVASESSNKTEGSTNNIKHRKIKGNETRKGIEDVNHINDSGENKVDGYDELFKNVTINGNNDKHQNDGGVKEQGDNLESVKTNGDDVFSNDEDYEVMNEIRMKRTISGNNKDGRKNANYTISHNDNNNNKDNIDERVDVYNENETIRDKENRVGATGRENDELISAPKTSRWDIYKVMENMMEQKGYDGRACMLRTICEAAETPFTHKNGVLGELVHILLTPSSTKELISSSHDKDYHTAELRGRREDVECDRMYPDCEESMLEMFSEIGFDHFWDG